MVGSGGGRLPSGESPVYCPYCGAGAGPADRFCGPYGAALSGSGDVGGYFDGRAGETASFPRRLVAFVVDIIAWVITVQVLWYILMFGCNGYGSGLCETAYYAWDVAPLVVFALQFVVLPAVWGKTPCKALLGIRLVDTSGGRLALPNVIPLETAARRCRLRPSSLVSCGRPSIKYTEPRTTGLRELEL